MPLDEALTTFYYARYGEISKERGPIITHDFSR